MNYDDWKLDPPEDQDEPEERDPDEVAEEQAEMRRIRMEMDGPHEEGP